MTRLHQPLLNTAFLRSVWANEFQAFTRSPLERDLQERLVKWRDRARLKEKSAEQTFVDVFFRETWGYHGAGEGAPQGGYTLYPKFHVKSAGQGGGTGEADLALGWFDRAGVAPTPQILCEFKDIRSGLDTPQKRKKNNRSPVQQCKDYLWGARQGLYGNEPVIPAWGIVTDMNEFRLYWWDRMPQQYMRFVIERTDLFTGDTLLDYGDEARFQRFLFHKLFHANTLLTSVGKPELARLLSRQWFREREIENEFYSEYRDFRDRLYKNLLVCNPKFRGTKGQLVRLAQKILDRCLFVFYCEDMGQMLSFPPQLLRDFLVDRSVDPYFDPSGIDIWERIKGLFETMNEGGYFPPDKKIFRFNGGLFATDKQLNSLRLTNDVFCEHGQGHNEANLLSRQDTLLYLSAAYSYADRSDAEKTLGLYALGRIFEQSITELEILEAEAEGRQSLNKLNKRKTNGVYYTPEWIVEKIVDETLGQRLADIRANCRWPTDKQPSASIIKNYWDQIRRIKIVDPACGSGAFLITALRHLRDEFRSVQDLRRQVDPSFRLPDQDELIENILSNNIYGVDINPASVEITKLALWLHTARPNRPLSALDKHIRDGNSLIDESFYLKDDLEEYAAEDRERINAFNWQNAFPEVFEQGGFDVVIGNPPYVKLQNFRKVYPDMAEYLREGRLGKSYYESTQSGNFDLYLPFIEKGMSLLNDQGQMGFIAPSLWLVNEYGEGLRRLVHRMRSLERWIDFKSFQVFEEVITYTALQFFTRRPNNHVALHQARTGEISAIDWNRSENRVPYEALTKDQAWHLLPAPERTLIDRLKKSCRRLDDPSISRAIYQGLITSADDIYHLKRLGPGRYLCEPGEKSVKPYEVTLEDKLMKPLVSGPEAKRYLEPHTDTYLLFPYAATDDGVTLISSKDLSRSYPNAWRYLRSYENTLRKREAYDKERQKKERRIGPFDDTEWYRFGRHQNLGKQETIKLIVAQTVTNMRVCLDTTQRYYLNNVRVNGILPADATDSWWLLGILNSPVCDFVFRRIAAPKGGGYFEANKQYIAPLPIPRHSKKDVERISADARNLQSLTTARHEVVQNIQRRMSTCKAVAKPEHWICPDIGDFDSWLAQAPMGLRTHEQVTWAKSEQQTALNSRCEEIQQHLHPSVRLASEYTNGELKFCVGDATPIERVYVDPHEGPFIHAQWDFIARTFAITENTKAKALVDTLRKLAPATNSALVNQVLELRRQLVEIEQQIAQTEKSLNELIYRAYELTPEEIALVERG